MIASIGPVWDGNEVWLLAGGGTLYFAFPALYAASFSGFYLPLMIVLWLLIVRGISIEFRSHVHPKCGRRSGTRDLRAPACCWPSSMGCARQCGARRASRCHRIFFPAAVDGFPRRFERRDSRLVHNSHRSCGLAGDNYARGVVGGDEKPVPRSRTSCAACAPRLVGSRPGHGRDHRREFCIQPHLRQRFAQAPWGAVFPILAIAGLLGVRFCLEPQTEGLAFLSSSGYLVGMLTSVVFGVYPLVLPASTDPLLS